MILTGMSEDDERTFVAHKQQIAVLWITLAYRLLMQNGWMDNHVGY